MATGNEMFSLFTHLGSTTFVILSVVTLIEKIYLKIRAHLLPKNEKSPLQVAVRCSKMPLLNLPIDALKSVQSVVYILPLLCNLHFTLGLQSTV